MSTRPCPRERIVTKSVKKSGQHQAKFRKVCKLASRASLYSVIEGRSRNCGGRVGLLTS